MEVVALPDGTFDVTILDDAASVCDGALVNDDRRRCGE